MREKFARNVAPPTLKLFPHPCALLINIIIIIIIIIYYYYYRYLRFGPIYTGLVRFGNSQTIISATSISATNHMSL